MLVSLTIECKFQADRIDRNRWLKAWWGCDRKACVIKKPDANFLLSSVLATSVVHYILYNPEPVTVLLLFTVIDALVVYAVDPDMT